MMKTESATAPAEAIILAGGKGTRLKEISGDIPKPMMPVCGKPFLVYLLQQLLDAGVQRTILSLGYRHELITSFFGANFKEMSLTHCIEEKPMGTGGALKKALDHAEKDNLIVMNGDSYYDVDIFDIFSYHVRECADITIALKYLDDCSRFGSVTLQRGRITSFREKGRTDRGYINGGVYVVNRRIVDFMPPESCFSLEKDLLENPAGNGAILPYLGDGYFIDIGTPDDYRKAQLDFADRMGTKQ